MYIFHIMHFLAYNLLVREAGATIMLIIGASYRFCYNLFISHVILNKRYYVFL